MRAQSCTCRSLGSLEKLKAWGGVRRCSSTSMPRHSRTEEEEESQGQEEEQGEEEWTRTEAGAGRRGGGEWWARL